MMISRYIAERRETLSLSPPFCLLGFWRIRPCACGNLRTRPIETRRPCPPARASESALGVFCYRPEPWLKAAVVAESGELSQRGEQDLLGQLVRLVAGERASDRPAVDAVDVIGEDHLVHCHQHPFACKVRDGVASLGGNEKKSEKVPRYQTARRRKASDVSISADT